MRDTRTVLRFWAKVSKHPTERGCRLWRGAIAKETGYGMFHVEPGVVVGAHVFAFSLHNGGPPSKGKQVMHSCDVRNCVEGTHLSAGTALQNNHDAIRKGRARALKGSDHPAARLNADQVRKARLLYRHKYNTVAELAKLYNVGESTMRDAVFGRTWKELTP